jgi:hypothetical protein
VSQPTNPYVSQPTNPGGTPQGDGREARANSFVWNILRTAFMSLLTLITLGILTLLLFPGLRPFLSPPPGISDLGREGALQWELAALREDYLRGLAGCVTQEASLHLPPLAKDELSMAEKPDEERNLLSVKVPEPKPKPEPKPGPKPKPAPKAVPSAPPKKAGPTEIKEAKDLEGCWETKPGFVNYYGQPMKHRYCFDKSGNATSYSANLGSSGKVASSCSNSAKAKLSGKNFTLTEKSPPPCPGWISGVYTCKLISTGVMRCTLVHGSGVDHTDFHYQGN